MRFYTGIKNKLLVLLLLAAANLFVHTEKTHADNINSFFEKDSVLNFDREITQKDNKHIEMLNPRKEKPSDTKENTQKVSSETPAAADDKDIISKYGDPTVEAPVVAQENAPKPFKGMLAALDAGDEELAKLYAKQYVNYIHKLDRTTKAAVDLQMKALEEQGMEIGEDVTNPAVEQVEAQKKNINSLEPGVKNFLKEAAREEDLIEDEPQISAKAALRPEHDEKRIRMEMRAKIASKAPVDPKGEVEVYFFLRSSDQKSIEMGREFERFYNKNKNDSKVLIKGLTIDEEESSAVSAFRGRNGATFRIENGSAFAEHLGVTKVPAVVAIAKNSGQAVVEEGMRNFYFLDELLGAIKGPVNGGGN